MELSRSKIDLLGNQSFIGTALMRDVGSQGRLSLSEDCEFLCNTLALICFPLPCRGLLLGLVGSRSLIEGSLGCQEFIFKQSHTFSHRLVLLGFWKERGGIHSRCRDIGHCVKDIGI